MPDTILTGGCQCGAVRYALSEAPESTVCHCRMCQKAVGGPFAAFCKVRLDHFAWTRGQPAAFRSSTAAERHFCRDCGTPLTFHYLHGDAIEVTTGSLDHPETVPIIRNFGADSRLPWIDRLMPGAVPDVPPSNPALDSRQHPDHETLTGWRPPA
ncbi:MAG TPA: GFA family protein [Rhodopila sp.]|uniref:GFA family protein n=1 Tax=Rhodopila sp. TaxID=2480087 RepID=UPI002B929923|nr:GFA family protein [Rhodopila sp.]HVY13953.1 GFA family protein [Rhodopila sp.]